MLSHGECPMQLVAIRSTHPAPHLNHFSGPLCDLKLEITTAGGSGLPRCVIRTDLPARFDRKGNTSGTAKLLLVAAVAVTYGLIWRHWKRNLKLPRTRCIVQDIRVVLNVIDVVHITFIGGDSRS